MTALKPYEDIYEPLELPIGGKTYVIPPVGAKDGLRFDAASNPSNQDAEHITDEEFYRIFLGAMYDEMIADNVSGTAISRAAMTALADFQRGRAVAEIMWETGGDPTAVEDYVAANLAPLAAAVTAPVGPDHE